MSNPLRSVDRMTQSLDEDEVSDIEVETGNTNGSSRRKRQRTTKARLTEAEKAAKRQEYSEKQAAKFLKQIQAAPVYDKGSDHVTPVLPFLPWEKESAANTNPDAHLFVRWPNAAESGDSATHFEYYCSYYEFGERRHREKTSKRALAGTTLIDEDLEDLKKMLDATAQSPRKISKFNSVCDNMYKVATEFGFGIFTATPLLRSIKGAVIENMSAAAREIAKKEFAKINKEWNENNKDKKDHYPVTK
ncbi:hypothetical protein HKX48_001450 [Thoreauomyces humboldtii]|nr:hypothetical protein HKX48_001450 [Thoreauomyces humboldtii]